MKIYYIANARMPSEKAHGIQIAKMCEAFIEAGMDLTLVVPRRATDPLSLQEYYGLRVSVPLVRLPAIDWYASGRIGYFLSSLSFMFSYTYFVFKKKRAGEAFILYTVDLDNYSSSALALWNTPLFSEMHGAKPNTFAQRALFKKAKGIIAINKIIVRELQETFQRAQAHYLVEPNGVDLSQFAGVDKRKARENLGLPHNIQIALYTGRFFAWKGLEILPQAARETPSIRWQLVGGDRSRFEEVTGETLPENMHCAGDRPHKEMALWFGASDALVVLGTVRDTQSYRYTSPMKLFEYFAAGRPIIASNTPALREIVSEEEVLFYEPDNAQDLARQVTYAVTHSEELAPKREAAYRLATASSWRARAERIMHFIDREAPV